MLFSKTLFVATGLVLALTATTQAQQTPPTTPNSTPGLQREGLRRTKGAHAHLGRKQRRLAFDRLNLTDQQKQQQRALMQQHLEATKVQRERLFELREKRLNGTLTQEDLATVNSLRNEVRSSRKALREETLNLLTPDQRSQFKSQRREFREEKLKRRQEKLKSPQL
ncbi:MAG TPA: Spy/CpxP family protein refolding chaperone [Pyrinomonadaceae bacterium]|nr:Spy/CpxP family protein refolding chaperone [Pyrinomonadaceae bacterium]